MTDLWRTGPTAEARGRRARGVSPQQVERLVALTLCGQSGAFRELTDAQKRVLSAHWLVEHGPLSDSPLDRTDLERAG